MGGVAETQPDGVRVGGQDAEDADCGVQCRGHLAVLQGDGALLHPRLSVGNTSFDH